MNFEDPQQLKEWLHRRAIDTSQWGCGAAKTVTNLWQELVTGDSELQLDPPLRKVRVVSVLVYQNDQQLIEAIQTFDDGRTRHPNRAPSEKMKPGETPEAAALRCLYEEASCTIDNVLTPPQLIKVETIYRDSPSYPTLQSEFVFHTLELSVQGLPTADFVTTNLATDDPIRAIHWSWRALT